jgi:hypothetical protein
VCFCVCPVQESAVLAVVMNRIFFVLESNYNCTRLGLPVTEDGGATMFRNADNPLTVDTA